MTTSHRFSNEIRAANLGLWKAMQAHPFVRAVEADMLPQAVFKNYLIDEHSFVEEAIGIFALMLAKAPGIAEWRWLTGVLVALTGEQIGYFEATFAALGIDPVEARRRRPEPAAVTAFRRGMRSMAEAGSYAEVVAIMLAAEWMYATWCARAAKGSIGDEQLRRWVHLHAAPEFAAQAAWLRDQLDAVAPLLDEKERSAVIAAFGEALRLEIDFHAAAFA